MSSKVFNTSRSIRISLLFAGWSNDVSSLKANLSSQDTHSYTDTTQCWPLSISAVSWEKRPNLESCLDGEQNHFCNKIRKMRASHVNCRADATGVAHRWWVCDHTARGFVLTRPHKFVCSKSANARPQENPTCCTINVGDTGRSIPLS